MGCADQGESNAKLNQSTNCVAKNSAITNKGIDVVAQLLVPLRDVNIHGSIDLDETRTGEDVAVYPTGPGSETSSLSGFRTLPTPFANAPGYLFYPAELP